MKKIALISAIALGGLFYNNANAQVLQIGLRLGGGHPVIQASLATPVAVGYSSADDYYYLPEVDAYYNAYEQAYYYNDCGRWVSAAYLPGEYRNYDWRNARHYEVRASRPYLNADVYREKYRGTVNNWGRNNDRIDNRSYGNRDDRRGNEPRFERRNDNYRGAEHAEGRGWDNRNMNNDRFNNRGQGYDRGNYNYNQPIQQGRGDHGYNQPAQQGRNQGGYNQPAQQGRGQGGYNQPAQQGGRDNNNQQNQPSRQNGSGQQQRGNSGVIATT
ncbi:hypothetical protein [Mucilaginibacter sp. UR6-11]|uniref:hypothetical protein n=1 Tax=Mucilaginibacter sp. UR6-11 TaxID=1435644 RepID=UPI001E63A0A7|nr:hypothetical protein [Mucilaginibacter sp. UR6-11]MCC8423307.1 hypothetical protein [Mucilaginibacter sp. UR6-11]